MWLTDLIIEIIFQNFETHKILATYQHSPTGLPAKPRPFLHPPAPVKIPNGRGVFAGFYLFLLEKEPLRNSGKARP